MKPGAYHLDDTAGPIKANVGRTVTTITVKHTGDRPIQVGSHFHFFEVNRALVFDREAAYGKRLNIPAGTAVRLEPGDARTVDLVDVAGERIMHGHNGLVNGRLDDESVKEAALAGIHAQGFGNEVGDA
ncbi:MAG: urease subunit beta [Chloroflexota bacterium]